MMNPIDYIHNTPPSLMSRILQTTMKFIGMKRRTERKMVRNTFDKEPAPLKKSLLRNFHNHEMDLNGRKVWTISPKEHKSDLVILYLHGGAYMGNILKLHWDLIEQLLKKTQATIIIPDYPLVPEATYQEIYQFVENLYAQLLVQNPNERIVFIGDSAGGGFALGFTQQLRNENRKQPDQLLLFSPWLDVTMSNPNIQIIDKKDQLLSIKGLKSAGEKYAGSIALDDYRVSPIYGNFSGLCPISIFTGTNDLLYPDAQKWNQLMKTQNGNFNYFEYPSMFHDWVIITSLKESQDVISKVAIILNEELTKD